MTARWGVATRLKLAKVMLITGGRRHTGDLGPFAKACLAGGVDIIQLRSTSVTATDLVHELVTLRWAASENDGLISAYGVAEYAATAKVDMLQLSALDGSAADARAELDPSVLVGRSCHSQRQVSDAIADPLVDFFTVSPVYNSTGVGEAGLSLVSYAAQVAPPSAPESKPWFAVGGVSLTNLNEVLACGARRIGVTRVIAEADDPEAAAAVVNEEMTQAWNADPGMENVVRSALS